MKRLALTIGVCILGLAVGAGLVVSQVGGADPWHRPLNPQGQSAGITYGTHLPTTDLVPGEIAVDMDWGGAGVPGTFQRTSTAWVRLLGLSGTGTGTANTLVKWDATGINLQDSVLSDDGTDLTLAAGGTYDSPSGAAADPTYGFTDDADSGIYYAAGAAGGVVMATDNNASTIVANTPPAVGASGDLHGMWGTRAIMNAANTTRMLHIDFNSPNDVGAANSNTFIVVDIDSFTGDASTWEVAYGIGDGFDQTIASTSINNPITVGIINGDEFIVETTVAAPGDQDIFTIDTDADDDTFTLAGDHDLNTNIITVNPGTVTAMNGADTMYQMYFSEDTYDAVVQGGAGNTYGAIYIEVITQDAAVAEYGITMDDGWDYDLHGVTSLDMSSTGQVTIDIDVAAVGDGEITFQDMPAAGAGATDMFNFVMGDAPALQAGDTLVGLRINGGKPLNETGGTWAMLEIASEADATDTNLVEYGIWFNHAGNELDAEIYFAGTNGVIEAQNSIDLVAGANDAIRLWDTGGTDVMVTLNMATNADILTVQDQAFGVGDVSLVLLDVDASNFAAGNDERALGIDIDYLDDPTGGTMAGIWVDQLNAGTGDANVLEYGTWLVNTGWDYTQYISGTSADIDHGITASVLWSPTLEANDNANDQRNVLLIDVDVPDGSAGLVNAINIDAIVDDINTIDSAIFIEGGWDGALHITERGGVATTNALANSVLMYVDDNADYSGGGGNDCAVVFRDAGGNMGSVIVNLNAACP